MIRFVGGRLASAFVLALGVASVTFGLLWFAPGDSRASLLLSGFADNIAAGPTPGAVESYLNWLGRVFRADLGVSESSGRAVVDVLGAALPHTLALSAAGLVLAALLGVSAGVVQASRAGSTLDRFLGFVSVVLYSAPSFWIGIVLAELFVGVPGRFGARWLPLSGVAPPGGAAHSGQYLPYLVLPALTLALVLGAGIARFTRASMLEILDQDYIRAARARGLSERTVLIRHGLRSASLPLVSLLGVYLPMLLTGAVFVEVVFERAGIGREMLLAITRQDIPVVAGGALLFGLVAVLANLLADLLYGWADPRLRDAAHG
ncbi:MAG: ABC transporter permease [Gemmatimonadetes bacterium]|nr:ABC transporter permease [Gemmatimonadota bacterium]